MSNDQKNEKPATTAPPAPPRPPVPKGGMRCTQLALAPAKGAGMILTSPREAIDQVVSRTAKEHSGYEIWYLPDVQSFRLDRFDNSVWTKSKRVHIGRVETFELADDQPPSSAA
jgi:hypothetical protein